MTALRDNRAALQWALGILAVIPMGSAVGEILRGPQGVPGGSPDIAPTVDSSLRYANVFKFASGVAILRELSRIERSSTVSFVLSTIAVGGLARIAASPCAGDTSAISQPGAHRPAVIDTSTKRVSPSWIWTRPLPSTRRSRSSMVNAARRSKTTAITTAPSRTTKRRWN